MTRQESQPAGLISVLLDHNAPLGDRDDAAMDLAAFDDENSEQALLMVATNPATSLDLSETCSESIAEIWARKGVTVHEDVLRRFPAPARRVLLETLRYFTGGESQ